MDSIKKMDMCQVCGKVKPVRTFRGTFWVADITICRTCAQQILSAFKRRKTAIRKTVKHNNK